MARITCMMGQIGYFSSNMGPGQGPSEGPPEGLLGPIWALFGPILWANPLRASSKWPNSPPGPGQALGLAGALRRPWEALFGPIYGQIPVQ